MALSSDYSGSIFRKPAVKKIRRSELNALLNMLRDTDTSLVKFGEAVSSHPSVLKQLMRAANSSLTGSVEITEAAHASLFLGARRVEFLLQTLSPEIIEEEESELADRSTPDWPGSAG